MADKTKDPTPTLYYLGVGAIPDVPARDLTAAEVEAVGGLAVLLRPVPPVYSPDPPAAYYLGGGYVPGVPARHLTAAELAQHGGWDFLTTIAPPLYSPLSPAVRAAAAAKLAATKPIDPPATEAPSTTPPPVGPEK